MLQRDKKRGGQVLKIKNEGSLKLIIRKSTRFLVAVCLPVFNHFKELRFTQGSFFELELLLLLLYVLINALLFV